MSKTACIIALLFATTASAQVAGRWTGTYTLTVQVTGCTGTFTMNGNATATFLESGTSITGRMDLTNVLFFNRNCSPAKGELTSALIGSVSGSNVTWQFPNDLNGIVFAGTVTGDQLSATISDSTGDSGSLTMTRTAVDPAATSLTGSWTGNYSFTDKCPNGSSTKSYNGQLTLGLTQTAGVATGVATMQNVPLYNQNCTTIALFGLSLSVAGVVNGSTFTGSVFDPSGAFDFDITANLSGSTLTGTVTGTSPTSTTGTFTLTPAATSAPKSDFAGSFAGTYNESDDERARCINIGFLQFSGPATLSVAQAGNAVSGFLQFSNELTVTSDGFGGCAVISAPDEVLPFFGTFDSTNSFTLTQPVGNLIVSITATLGANSITGSLSDSAGDTATFNATRTTNPPAPTITTFGASPPVIAPGQKTTLFWSTSNATSVAIDNGIGPQAFSGSMTIAPKATTTYTLTANGAGGTTTSKITVVVAPPQARHRATRP